MKSLNSSVALLFFISVNAYKPDDNFIKKPQLNYNYPMLNIQDNNRVTDIQRVLIDSFKEHWEKKIRYNNLELKTFDIMIDCLENAYQLESGVLFDTVMRDLGSNIISYCGSILNDMDKSFKSDEQKVIIDNYHYNVDKFANKVMFKDDVNELLVLVRKMKTTFSEFKNARMQKIREWQNKFSMTDNNAINISNMRSVVDQIIYGAIPLVALEEKQGYFYGSYRAKLFNNLTGILEYIERNCRMDMNRTSVLTSYSLQLQNLRNKNNFIQQDLSELLALIKNIQQSYNVWK